MSETAEISIDETDTDKPLEPFHSTTTSPPSGGRDPFDVAASDQAALGSVRTALNQKQNTDILNPQKTEKFRIFSISEKQQDREYSQEELLALVKEAETRGSAIRGEEKTENEIPLSASNSIPSDEVQTSPSSDEKAFTLKIMEIEDQILDYEKKAKGGDEKAKRELGILLVEQWQLLGDIYKQRQADKSSAHHGTNKPASIRRGLFPSLVRLYKKMNGPDNNELNSLRHLVRVKEAKAGIRTGLRTWRTPKGTASELAARITELQYGKIPRKDKPPVTISTPGGT